MRITDRGSLRLQFRITAYLPPPDRATVIPGLSRAAYSWSSPRKGGLLTLHWSISMPPEAGLELCPYRVGAHGAQIRSSEAEAGSAAVLCVLARGGSHDG